MQNLLQNEEHVRTKLKCTTRARRAIVAYPKGQFFARQLLSALLQRREATNIILIYLPEA